jgi:tryptophan synthase alpha chain
MSRYARMFERLGGEGAFGAFVMLGDPDLKGSARLLELVVAAGADMVEVGIPFSDPIADGPVIQAAAARASAAGARVDACLGVIECFRAAHPDVPIGILTYANLVMSRGRETFFAAARSAGADSLLVADLPAIEAPPWSDEMREAGLEPVLIAADNTSPETLSTIARLGSGYTYCVTRAGITGTHAEPAFGRELLGKLKAAGAPPPVFGFGISTPAHVRAALAAGAAGVICGSAIVSAAAEGRDAAALVASLKSATRNDSAPS